MVADWTGERLRRPPGYWRTGAWLRSLSEPRLLSAWPAGKTETLSFEDLACLAEIAEEYPTAGGAVTEVV